jgi:S-adenosylmethionine:tRNA ribosyltransferase-isomerase
MMNETRLKLSDFHYDLPSHLIAQVPKEDPLQDKLIIRYQDGHIRHQQVGDLGNYIPSNSLIIANNSQVFPSRIKGRFETGGQFEIMLLALKKGTTNSWQALGKPLKKLKLGRVLRFEGPLQAKITRIQNDASPTIDITFECPLDQLYTWLETYGYIPLPPYIKRVKEQVASHSKDRANYQTTFAKAKGSVAAPTAGLHFNQNLINQLESRGVELTTITHHVGAGTFLPVKVQDLTQHTMHTESYYVSSSTDALIRSYKDAKKPIIVIGTTTFRCLETFYHLNNQKTDTWLSTDLFVYPNYRSDRYIPKVPDALITNFHQPCSTLFMLLCALIGLDQSVTLYNEAIKEAYRFFSYGDTSLLWLKNKASLH